jgi:hypothetical protein
MSTKSELKLSGFASPTNLILETKRFREQLHFVLPLKRLCPGARHLLDFPPTDLKSAATVAALLFIAEAVGSTGIEFRGAAHGSCFQDTNPRVVVQASYIPRSVFVNERSRTARRSQEYLVAPENTVAIMFSVFLCDPALSFAQLFDDQLLINSIGRPVVDFQRPLRFARNPDDAEQQQQQPTRPDGVELVAPDQTLRESPHLKFPSDPGYSALGARSRFARGNKRPPSSSSSKQPEESSVQRAWTRIRTNQDFVTIAYSTAQKLRINDRNPILETDTPGIAKLRDGAELNPLRVFSLENALRRLAKLGAHPLLQDKQTWFNEYRLNDARITTFGAPAWRDGVVPDMPDLRYTACTGLEVCFNIPLKLFNANSLGRLLLPHHNALDAAAVRPYVELTRTVVSGEGGRNIVLEDLFREMGVEQAVERYAESSVQLDCLEEHFSKNARPVADLLRTALASDDRTQYVETLARVRADGYRAYQAAFNNAEQLPLAYRNMKLYHDVSQNSAQYWAQRRPMHLFLSAEARLSPFAQFRTIQLIGYSTALRVADCGVLEMPHLLRTIYTIYLPWLTGRPMADHTQLVGMPGTSKSELLKALMKIVIKNTVESISSGTNRGLTGEPVSERMGWTYDECPQQLYPTHTNISASEAKELLDWLTRLSEGKPSYWLTVEDTETGGRKFMKVGHQFSNGIIAARNVRPEPIKEGMVKAMADRFSYLTMYTVTNPDRVSTAQLIFSANSQQQQLDSGPFQGMMLLQHRLVMQYCAAMSYYAVPTPGTELSSALAPLAISYIAKLRPDAEQQLRKFTRLFSRQNIECVVFGVQMAVMSALSSDFEEASNSFESTKAHALEMNEKLMRAISHYTYVSIDMLLFLLSELVFDLVPMNTIHFLRGVALECRYYRYGTRNGDRTSDRQWPVQQPQEFEEEDENNNGSFEEHVPTHFLSNMVAPVPNVEFNQGWTLQQFWVHLTTGQKGLGEHPYILGSSPARSSNSSSGRGGVNSGYVQRPLYQINDKQLREALIELACGELDPQQNSVRMPVRPTIPQYKYETPTNELQHCYNPNYFTVVGTLESFAERQASVHFNGISFSKEMILRILHDLCDKHITTIYLPCVISELMGLCASDVQSLRHCRYVLERAPMYRVPVLIEEPQRFHILISYLETDPHMIMRGVAKRIAYPNAFERSTIINSSLGNKPFYETVEFRASKEPLQLLRENNLTENLRPIIRNFCDNAEKLPIAEEAPLVDYDLEEQCALDYLKRNFPKEANCEDFTPRGIFRRFYDQDVGVYANPNLSQMLFERSYHEFVTGSKPQKTAAAAAAASAAAKGNSRSQQQFAATASPKRKTTETTVQQERSQPKRRPYAAPLRADASSGYW